MSGSSGGSGHDLNNAGNVMGSMYNTNKYEPDYKEKKGMRFFWIMLAIVTLASAIFLMIKPYPDIDVVRAGAKGVTYYKISVNIFGKQTVETERLYPYANDSTMTYYGLTGNLAEAARATASLEADFLVASKDDMEKIAEQITLEPAASYVNIVKADTDSILVNQKNGQYALPVSPDYGVIDFQKGEYLALLPSHSPLGDGQFRSLIKKMTTIYD